MTHSVKYWFKKLSTEHLYDFREYFTQEHHRNQYEHVIKVIDKILKKRG